MTERIRRKTTGNHRPHVKDERTTGPFSLIETSSTYSISKSTDLLSFYETLGYTSDCYLWPNKTLLSLPSTPSSQPSFASLRHHPFATCPSENVGRFFLFYGGVLLWSVHLTFRLSLLPHHSDKCPTRCRLFSTFIFVRLFVLISPYVLFADWFLTSGSNCQSFKLGLRSQNSSQHSACSYIRDSLGAIRRASFSWRHSRWMEFGMLGPLCIDGDVANSCRYSRILSCVFLVVCLTSACLPDLSQLPYFRDTVQEFSAHWSFLPMKIGYD